MIRRRAEPTRTIFCIRRRLKERKHRKSFGRRRKRERQFQRKLVISVTRLASQGVV